MNIPIGWFRRAVRFTLLLVLVSLGLSSLLAQTVFVVRHAERTGDPDPPLNEEGQRRAQALARLLSEANVTHFYTSEAVRARQTAEPTARRAGKQIEILKDKDIEGIVRGVRANTGAGQATLVVGHRSTVPLIVKALGGGDIPKLNSAEHDRLIVLTLLPDGEARAVTLRYGAESPQR
jgi:broad specificity phosphatase PhoE